MNKQEIYDFVANHLISQGRRAVPPGGGGCKYRVWDKDVLLSCAAGCLIPDEAYVPQMERNLVPQLVKKFKKLLPDWFIQNECLIENLQGVHDLTATLKDGHFDMVRLKERLIEVAEFHKLKAISL